MKIIIMYCINNLNMQKHCRFPISNLLEKAFKISIYIHKNTLISKDTFLYIKVGSLFLGHDNNPIFIMQAIFFSYTNGSKYTIFNQGKKCATYWLGNKKGAIFLFFQPKDKQSAANCTRREELHYKTEMYLITTLILYKTIGFYLLFDNKKIENNN